MNRMDTRYRNYERNNERNRTNTSFQKELPNLTEENYVTVAKTVIDWFNDEKVKNKRRDFVTMTKLRGLLSMLADIYNEILVNSANDLSPEVRARISYLKVRFLYDSGKENLVKEFVARANIMKYLENIKGDKKEFLLFYHYMEALIAYFKFYGLVID